MSKSRQVIQDIVTAIEPFDELEAVHRQDVLDWVKSGALLFRVAKPDTPPKHLVAYFVLFDVAHQSMMLVDHAKAKLWLPTGGHVDPDEDPRATVVREAEEELGLQAQFTTPLGDTPLFVTATTTRGYGEHTDVSLWYAIAGDQSRALVFDTREMHSVRWHTLSEIMNMDPALLDPHMHRFVRKLQTKLV